MKKNMDLKVYDIILISISWLISYFIRFDLLPKGQVGLGFTFLLLWPILILFSFYWLNNLKLYEDHFYDNIFDDILNIFKANFYTNLTFVFVLYFLSTDKISRFVIIFHFLVSTFLLILFRIGAKNKMLKQVNKENLLILHDDIENPIFENSKYNVRHESLKNIQPEAFLKFIKENGFKKIIVPLTEESQVKWNELFEILKNELLDIIVIPQFKSSYLGYNVKLVNNQPWLIVNRPMHPDLQLYLKRLMDFFGAGFGLLLLSPLFLIIALLVKLSSRGPIFYGQERVGFDGVVFKMWKFRSMKVSSEPQKAQWTVENDPRRTAIGTFIRSTSIDELPQLWNVFVGQMSLVGPRPEQPFFVDKFKSEVTDYIHRHKMKAGITGWAQVNGWRGDTSIQKRIDCDLYYIRNWSFWFDIKILFLTLFKGFINKNAY